MSIVQAVDYHVPVMLEECLEGMNLQPTGHYVDVTSVEGGTHVLYSTASPTAGISTPSTKIPMLRHEPRRRSAHVRRLELPPSRAFMDYYEELGRWMRSWLTSVSPPITLMIWSVALAP